MKEETRMFNAETYAPAKNTTKKKGLRRALNPLNVPVARQVHDNLRLEMKALTKTDSIYLLKILCRNI